VVDRAPSGAPYRAKQGRTIARMIVELRLRPSRVDTRKDFSLTREETMAYTEYVSPETRRWTAVGLS
jgi:hypothetical protein